MRTLLLLTALICGVTSARPAYAQGPGGPTFEQRVSIEAVRNRINRVKGGDFDDKLDRISFVVKFKNTDIKQAFTGCKAEFYVFAQSIMNRKAYQLLGVDRSDISLPPLGTAEMSTAEVSTRYDTTGAIFGAKYDSWVLVVRDGAGKMIFKKSSNTQWQAVADKLSTLSTGKYYDHDLKEQNVRL